MTKKKYQRYSSEFKRLALRRASEDGVTDKEVWKISGSVNASCDAGEISSVWMVRRRFQV